MDIQQLRHRALASPVRAQLLVLLRRAEHAVGVDWLADRLDLHPNTVRSHLGVLVGAGLVESEPRRQQGRGRPRLVYSPVTAEPDPEEGHPGSGYRLIAAVLADQFEQDVPDAPQAAHRAGVACGRRLVDAPPPGRPLSGPEVLDRLTDLLARLGFEPRVGTSDDSTRVELRRCPFAGVAREHPRIACAVHRGITEGALDRLGGRLAVVDLERGEDGCVTWLSTSPAARDRRSS